MNRNQIKYIVIAAMVIDHIAWAFVPLASVAGQLMHFVGRLTGPTMAFFLAEGYRHTRSVKRYALRLFFFALLSWAPFCFFEYGRLPVFLCPAEQLPAIGISLFTWGGRTVVLLPVFGVLHTLFLSLIALWVWDRRSLPVWCRILLLVPLCFLAQYGDWSYYNILFALTFFCFRDDPKLKWGFFSAIGILHMLAQGIRLTVLFQCGVFLVPLLLHFYNGESGSKAPFHKWFFYVFYPAHLLLFGILQLAV